MPVSKSNNSDSDNNSFVSVVVSSFAEWSRTTLLVFVWRSRGGEFEMFLLPTLVTVEMYDGSFVSVVSLFAEWPRTTLLVFVRRSRGEFVMSLLSTLLVTVDVGVF